MLTVILAVVGVVLFCVAPFAVILAALGAWIGGAVGAVIGAVVGLFIQARA